MKAHTQSLASLKNLLKVGLFSNVIEWYEFSVYGSLSAVIGRLFFKTPSPTLQLIQAFGIIAVSYFARPIGSLFFGIFSDRYGRSASLKFSLILMSVPTILIGLLPTYQTLGAWATGLLLSLRLIQGFAAGGEFPVNACYIFEAAPIRSRSLLVCTVSMSNVLGFFFGSAMGTLLLSTLTTDQIDAWSWRIPFFLGIPLTLCIMKIRNSLVELSLPNPTRYSWKKFIQYERKSLLIGIFLATLPAAIGTQMLSLWMPFYLNHFLHYSIKTSFILNTFMLLSGIVFSFLAAWLTRFIPIRTLVKTTILLTLLLTYPLFFMMQNASWSHLLIILLIFKLLISGTGGIIMEILAKLFAPQVRSTGMALSFSIAAGIFSGITPLACTVLTYRLGLYFPAFYAIIFLLAALIAAIKLPQSMATLNNG